MSITVQFTAQLKAALGTSEETMDTDGAITGKQLLQLMIDKYGESFRDYAMDENGQLIPSLIVCLNDQQIDLCDETELPSGSVVTLLSAISGG